MHRVYALCLMIGMYAMYDVAYVEQALEYFLYVEWCVCVRMGKSRMQFIDGMHVLCGLYLMSVVIYVVCVGYVQYRLYWMRSTFCMSCMSTF